MLEKDDLQKTIFEACHRRIANAYFLDLFEGAGTIGMEALRQGASHVTFVGNTSLICQNLEESNENWEYDDRLSVMPGDVLATLHKLKEQGDLFDIVFLSYSKALQQIATVPFEVGLSVLSYPQELIKFLVSGRIVKPRGIVLIEEEKSNSLFRLSNLSASEPFMHLRNKHDCGSSFLWEFRAVDIMIEESDIDDLSMLEDMFEEEA